MKKITTKESTIKEFDSRYVMDSILIPCFNGV